MITTVGIEEAAARLGELLDRTHRGETVIITRDGSAVAQLTACAGEAPTTPERLVDLFERCHTGPHSMVDLSAAPPPRSPLD